ncbi:putative lipid II flippase FtsW [Clostridia bacterium]|nr:putative lipid II flippase FtsW [Clostridia bacterium]
MNNSRKGNYKLPKIKKKINPRTTEIPLGRPDIILIMLVVLLTAFGLFMLMSASNPRAIAKNDETGLFFVNRQILYIAVGGIVGFLIGVFRWTRIFIQSGLFVWGFYIVTVLGLILTPFIGDTANDTTLVRSINIGPVSIQFSEIAKFTIPLIMAWWVATYYQQFAASKAFNNWKNLKHFVKFIITPIILAAVPIGLVLFQKHKSATMILGLILFTMLIVSNLRIKWLIMGILLAAGAVFYYGTFVDDSTASSRVGHMNINVFKLDDKYEHYFDMNAQEREEEWQTYNSLLAIGSGGATGLGYGNSRQKYFYLPEPHNDFIFAVICEELGFFISLLVILAYLLLILRGFYIAANVPDKFLSLLVSGIMAHISLQVLFNLVVVTGIINTGISLPFISYGGSALVVQLCEMGIVVAVSRYVPKNISHLGDWIS